MAINEIRIDNVKNVKKDFSQACLVRKYGEDKRPSFNSKFFTRSDEDIIKALEKVILSWQREKYFCLKVINFTVETSHIEIERILAEHNAARNKNKSAKSRNNTENDFINLKDSAVMLLIVDYYIEVYSNEGSNKDKKTKDTMQVLILVPRLVDQYFMYINGNTYCPTYQIVDGSIYNNSDKVNAKSDMVSYKTDRPIRINRYRHKLTLYNKEVVDCIMYTSNIFQKPGIAMRFIFAKFGLNDGLGFLGLRDIFVHRGLPQCLNDDRYIFKTGNPEIYVSVSKYLFDNDYMTQSAVSTIVKSVMPVTQYEQIFTIQYWVATLVWNFKDNDPKYENGYKLLYNLETIYSITSRELLRLPDQDKSTVYHVIRWIMREFPELRARDNVDIYYKRIRYEEYIAALYAAKLSQSILRITDYRSNNLTVEGVKKSIYTKPTHLLQCISKDSLKNHINRTNDNHAFTVLKASYKGTSGVGESSKKNVSDRYKNVHYSHAGVIDMTSSSASEPGMTTLLCPLGNIQDDGFFYDYKEPNGWEDSYNELLNNYYELNNIKNALELEEALVQKGSDVYVEKHMVIESLEIVKRLIEPFKTLEALPMIHILPKYRLEESGQIIYEQVNNPTTGIGEEY